MGVTPESVDDSEQQQMNEIRVLLVDDDRDFVELTADYLEREQTDLEVTTETNPRDALERLDRERIDCIISDYEMQPFDGLELLSRVREESDIPFLLLTAKGSEDLASEAISAGVTDYLQKGFGIDHYTILANRVLNVVEQYRSRQELTESRNRLNLFYEQSPLGVIEWDEQLTVVDLNQTAQQILGYNTDDLAGESWERLVPDSRIDSLDDGLESLLQNGGGYQQITENVTRHGERITCEWHNRVVMDESGEIETIFSQFQDVSDRERRKEGLANLHEVSTELLESDTQDEVLDRTIEAARSLLSFDSAGLVTVDDGEFEVADVSSDPIQAELSAADDAGLLSDVYGQGDVRIVEDVYSVELDTSESPSLSIMYVPIEGHGVLQVARNRPNAIDDIDRELTKLLVNHVRNGLDQLAYEREMQTKNSELAEKNEKLDEFVSVVSHDLRNPVQSLRSSLELAEQTGNDDDFERCYRSISRIEGLLEDLLTLARNRGEIEPETHSLQTLCEAAIQNLPIEEVDVQIEADTLIQADRSRCLQLFGNLIHNAIEHGGDDVTVRVGTVEDGFYVEDDGPGIPESEREVVFEHGYSGSENGTGFGLAIVEQVAEDHDWDLTVTSSDEGGARFEVTSVESNW